MTATCEVCGNGFIQETGSVLCTKCSTPHHEDCFQTGGCSIYGCGSLEYAIPKYENNTLVSLTHKNVEKRASELSDIIVEKALVPQDATPSVPINAVDAFFMEHRLKSFFDSYVPYRMEGKDGRDAFIAACIDQQIPSGSSAEKMLLDASQEWEGTLQAISLQRKEYHMDYHLFQSGLMALVSTPFLYFISGDVTLATIWFGLGVYGTCVGAMVTSAKEAAHQSRLDSARKRIIRKYSTLTLPAADVHKDEHRSAVTVSEKAVQALPTHICSDVACICCDADHLSCIEREMTPEDRRQNQEHRRSKALMNYLEDGGWW